MKQVARLFMGVLVTAFMVASVTPAMAKDMGMAAKMEATQKVVFENDKVRVTETTWKPGAETASIARLPRVVLSMTGGTVTRIYPDGKTEKITSKKGQVRYFDATPPYVV